MLSFSAPVKSFGSSVLSPITSSLVIPSSTITFTGYASNAWARFENPIAGTDYDYLYGFKEYADVPNTRLPKFSSSS